MDGGIRGFCGESSLAEEEVRLGEGFDPLRRRRGEGLGPA